MTKALNYLVMDNVAWFIGDDDELCIAPVNPNGVDWENGIAAKDVDNWEGTRWEDMSPTHAMIDAERDLLLKIFNY
jgi:hypothetical protein